MATEVVHGSDPEFRNQVTGEPYGLTIVGRYTTTPDLTAGGVTGHAYSSGQDAKRRAELLGMRTIFLHWWLREWLARGGDLRDAVAHVAGGLFDTAEKIAGGRA